MFLMSAMATGTSDTITNEYRLAVVMYGGISLAIYMNGIAQELLALVRSTAVEPAVPGIPSPMLENIKGTEAVYRTLALLLSEQKDGTVHTRFVIDIISGTSAGGINGVFLAKALTGRKDMQSLKRTWIEEGDFQKLLNDQSLDDISLPKQIPPRSLLSGERMFVKLFEAFAEMDQDPGPSYVDDLELSVTTTDLLGKLTPLRLADRVVWERRYKQVFHLRYSKDEEVNDFEIDNTPFLAFAARCTSSFPVAFEPMQLESIPRLLRTSDKYGAGYNHSLDEWKELFSTKWQGYFGPPDLQTADSERFFADGGYLDNRPFDHAIESLPRMSSPVRSERKLLYIEPSPEHPERGNAGKGSDGRLIQPDAIENAWDGLAAIPGKQPIRDSLMQIQGRNRLISKVNAVIGEISDTVAASAITAKAQRMQGRTGDKSQAVVADDPGMNKRPGLQAYQALNVYSVTDDLAIRIARLSGISEDSDYLYAIRCFIKVWRQDAYQDNDAKFLLDFDISYRMRRYRFVRSQIEMLSRLDGDAKARLKALNFFVPVSPAENEKFRREVDGLRGVLDSSFRELRKASYLASNNAVMLRQIEALDIKGTDLDHILGIVPTAKRKDFSPAPVIDDRTFGARARCLLTTARKQKLEELRATITGQYGPVMTETRNAVAAALIPGGADSAIRQAVLGAAQLYFYGFQEFDAAIFPITFGTNVGDLVPVDVIRVSPEDAIAIQNESETHRPKLAGASFGAFGAFLERVWRTNDILWGRLDGAERIIRALAGQRPEADDLIRRAHDAIIAEDLTPANQETICQMLLDSLLREGGDEPASPKTRQEMLNEVEECVRAETGSPDINPKLLAVLRQALTTDRLRASLTNFDISREPNRKRTLQSAARSARIIGRILANLGRTRELAKKPSAVLVQAGSLLWGMVEVATPGSISGAIFSYWFGLLLLFSVVMILGGTLFSQPMQSLGFRLLVLTLTARLSVSVLRTYIAGDKRWKRVLEAMFVAGVLLLVGLGLVELHNIWVCHLTPWGAGARGLVRNIFHI
jgi:patatin-related protein